MQPLRDHFPVADAEVRWVEIRPDLRLRIVVRGDISHGPILLLVHGLASNARMWDGVGRALADSGIANVAVDLRGHGLSDKPDDGYDFDSVLQDLVDLLAALGRTTAIIVGQSWGGNIAVHALRHRPDTFSSGVAVDGGYIELQRSFPSWTDCARQLQPPQLAGMRAGRIESAIRSMNADWPESGIIGALSNFQHHDDGTISPWLTLERHMMIIGHLWEHRPSEMFPHIAQPLLLLPADSGDASWTHDKERSIEAALELLANGRVHWFRPAHHDLHAQLPMQTAQVVLAHLEEGFLV